MAARLPFGCMQLAGIDDLVLKPRRGLIAVSDSNKADVDKEWWNEAYPSLARPARRHGWIRAVGHIGAIARHNGGRFNTPAPFAMASADNLKLPRWIDHPAALHLHDASGALLATIENKPGMLVASFPFH